MKTKPKKQAAVVKKDARHDSAPHTPGPWASLRPGMGDSESNYEIWTALPGGKMRRLAVVDESLGSSSDAALMAASPQLAHEVRACFQILEKLLAAPGALDVLADLCQESDLEAALVHRVGCLRHLAKIVGSRLSPGTYELSQAEARWHVPEQAYRVLGGVDDSEGMPE